MATTDSELKKLNKNVDDAVKILKVAYGNSAQIANMNDKQKEAIDKLLQVSENAEDEIKKTRAFTERARDENGKFLSKKAKETSGKFLEVAQSLKGIITSSFKGTINIAKQAWGGISSHFRNFFSQLKSQFLGLFGEESEWFSIMGSLKDSVMGFFGWIKGGIFKIFGKTPKWAKSTVEYLKNIYHLQLTEYKKGLLGNKDPKKKLGFLGILGLALALGVAFLAAQIKRKILAVLMLFKALGVGRLIEVIKLKYAKFFGRLAKFVGFLERIPILGSIIRGLKMGIGKLFLPLTIILSVIDFVRGFMATEGDILDKIMGGLKGVLTGFMELPIRILGWVMDKIFGWLGFETPEGGWGNKLMELYNGIIDFFIEKIKFGLSESGAWLSKVGGDIGSWIKDLNPLQAIKDFIQWITDMFEGIVNYAHGSRVLSTLMGIEYIDPNKNPTYSPMPKVNMADYTSEHERRKMEYQNNKDEKLQSKIDESTQATKEAASTQKATSNAITAIANNGGNGTTINESKQIPDELDNNLINMRNYMMH